MQVEFDDSKNRSNIEKHGVSLEDVVGFDFVGAKTEVDNRKDYRETRYRSLGYLKRRLYVCIWTPRPDAVRMISLRKANARERKEYAQR